MYGRLSLMLGSASLTDEWYCYEALDENSGLFHAQVLDGSKIVHFLQNVCHPDHCYVKTFTIKGGKEVDRKKTVFNWRYDNGMYFVDMYDYLRSYLNIGGVTVMWPLVVEWYGLAAILTNSRFIVAKVKDASLSSVNRSEFLYELGTRIIHHGLALDNKLPVERPLGNSVVPATISVREINSCCVPAVNGVFHYLVLMEDSQGGKKRLACRECAKKLEGQHGYNEARTQYMCIICKAPLHLSCFAPFHGISHARESVVIRRNGG